MSQTVNVTTVSIQVNGSQQAQGQGTPPAQPQQPNVPQHHQQPNQPGASPPHVQLPGAGGGGEGDMNGGDQHIGNAQDQPQQQDNT